MSREITALCITKESRKSAPAVSQLRHGAALVAQFVSLPSPPPVQKKTISWQLQLGGRTPTVRKT